MLGKVNIDLCIGCGACETVLPEAFKIEEGKAICIAENDNIEAAVVACPMEAITIVELVKNEDPVDNNSQENETEKPTLYINAHTTHSTKFLFFYFFPKKLFFDSPYSP